MSFTSAVGPNGSSTYTYDDNGQLTATDHSFQTDESYSYDLNGNRTMTGYSTGTNNRLLSDGTFNYTYDNEGNRLTRTRISGAPADDYLTEYTWDHHNRLTKVTYKNNAGTVTKEAIYTYDVFDRRIKKSVDSEGAGAGPAVITEYAYDNSWDIQLAFNGTGALTNRYLHGPAEDNILADEQFTPTQPGQMPTAIGDLFWLLADNLGTVRDVVQHNIATNVTSVVNHLTYDAYGKVTSETNGNINHIGGFQGAERDEETGMQLHDWRHYDPSIGRWISEDPIGFASGDTSLARFVGNGPTNGVDPSGLETYPVNRIQQMIKDGLATKVTVDGIEWVVISDIVGTDVVTVVLRLSNESPTPGRGRPDYRYRIVHSTTIGFGVNDEGVAPLDFLTRLRDATRCEDGAKRAVQKFRSIKEAERVTRNSQTFIFFAYMAPGVATIEYAKEGEIGEALISFGGDLAMVLAGPVGKLAQGGRHAKLVFASAAVLEGGVASTRVVQGVLALNAGDSDAAIGYFGEAFLRLAGTSGYALAAKCAPRNSTALVRSRVDELRNAIPEGSRGRITMAVAVVEDAKGNRSVLIATSEPRGYLRPGVTLKPGETMVKGTGHAEADIIKHANDNNLKVIDIGATRPVCVSCQDNIAPTGANIATPKKPKPPQ